AVSDISNAAREQAEAAVDTAASVAADVRGELRAALDAQASELREEIDGVAPRIDSLAGDVTRAVERAEATSAEARAAAEEGTGALREELDSVRAATTSANAELATARADLITLRQESTKILEEVAMSRQQAQAAMQRAQAGDQRIEGLSSELTFALATLDELKAGLTSAGQAAIIARREAESAKKASVAESEKNNERVSEVFREIIGLAARSGGGGGGGGGGNVLRRAELGKLRAKRESEVVQIPTRAPRHGFDDVSQPLAVLNLKGKFCELNPAFSKLVGYQEHEFLKAVWPSVHDRAVLQEQTDQLKAMVAGELETIEFQSSYMHSQGLMVAVDGELTLVRDEGGEPLSLLLTAKER
ncbi:MAG: PAS domain-containing protein, partial [Solirubrobacteraceae bacterium]